MEKSTPLTCLRSSLTRVLLPEPDGAEMIKRIPATCDYPFAVLMTTREVRCLFCILNLLAGFFYLRFHRQTKLGDPRTFAAHAAGF